MTLLDPSWLGGKLVWAKFVRDGDVLYPIVALHSYEERGCSVVESLTQDPVSSQCPSLNKQNEYFFGRTEAWPEWCGH